jgi:hypothetical protein
MVFVVMIIIGFLPSSLLVLLSKRRPSYNSGLNALCSFRHFFYFQRFSGESFNLHNFKQSKIFFDIFIFGVYTFQYFYFRLFLSSTLFQWILLKWLNGSINVIKTADYFRPLNIIWYNNFLRTTVNNMLKI